MGTDGRRCPPLSLGCFDSYILGAPETPTLSLFRLADAIKFRDNTLVTAAGGTGFRIVAAVILGI